MNDHQIKDLKEEILYVINKRGHGMMTSGVETKFFYNGLLSGEEEIVDRIIHELKEDGRIVEIDGCLMMIYKK